jgi:hypothetical protein
MKRKLVAASFSFVLVCVLTGNAQSPPPSSAKNGFVGQAFGVGPIVTYSTKIGKSHLDFNARFVHEFENRNRPEGNLFQFSGNLKF